MQRLAELLDARRRRQGERAADRAAGVRRGPAGRVGARDVAPPGRRVAAAGPSWSRPTRRRCRDRVRAGREAALPLLATLARAYEKELANPEAAIERNQAILEIAPKRRRGGRRARAALHRHRALRRAAGDLRQEAGAGEDRSREAARSASSWPASTRTRSSSPRRRSSSTRRSSSRIAEQLPALQRARSHLHRPRPVEGAGGDASTRARPRAPTRGAHRRAQVPPRRGCASSTSTIPRARSTSYREALALAPDARGRARRRCRRTCSDRELQMAAVEVLEPIYEQTEDLPAPGRGAADPARPGEEHRPSASRCCCASARCEPKLGDAEEAWDAYAQRLHRGPDVDSRRARRWRTWRTILDSWDAAGHAVRGRARQQEAAAATLERELLLVVAVAYDEKLEKSEKAVEYFRRAQEIEPEDASALVALERLYTRTERWPDLIETLRKKAELVAGRRRARADPHPHRHRLGGDARQLSTRPSRPGTRSSATTRENLQALRALDRLYLARERVPRAGRQPAAAAGADRRIRRDGRACSARLGLLREQQLDEPGAAVETYRRVLELEPEHAETIAALERILPNPEHELAVAQLLEPVYRARGDYPQPGRASTRSRRATPSTPEQKIASSAQIADGYEVGLDDPERAYDALGRALREDPLDPEMQAQIERLARVLGKLDDLVQPLRVAGRRRRPTPSSKNALYHKIAHAVARWTCGATSRRPPPTSRRSRPRRAISTRPTRWSRSTCATRRLREAGRAAAAQGGHRRRRRPRRRSCTTRRRSSTRRCWRTSRRRSTSTAQVLRVDEPTAIALDQPRAALHPPLALGRPQGRLRQEGRAGARRRPRRSRCCSCSVRSTTASCRDPARAIETYTSILDLDPEDYDAAQALDRLYQQTERWYDLLAILERQTELAPVAGRGGLAALPHRRAVARAPEGPRRAPSRPTATSWRWTRRTSRRCARWRR